MTFRTFLLSKELLHTLHALFILDLVQGIKNGGSGAVIGEIHFRGGHAVFVFGPVEDMSLLHRSVIDDFLFSVAEIFERHIRAHTHLSGHVCH